MPIQPHDSTPQENPAMSHLTLHSRLSEFIEACPNAAPVFMQMGADCHRCGDKTLDQFSAEVGVDRSQLLDVLLTASPRSQPKVVDWSKEPVPRLVDHIVGRHHEFVRRQLTKMQVLIDCACHTHCDRLPGLGAIRETFTRLQMELKEHLIVEEEVLFPLIRSLDSARNRGGRFMGPVDRSVSQIGHNFDEAASNLRQLRRLTGGFCPGPDSCPAYQSFLEELSNLESDLERHVYLENGILFPRAMELEKDLLKR
jgi:regulator of cell morphogenesis and NO signaling